MHQFRRRTRGAPATRKHCVTALRHDSCGDAAAHSSTVQTELFDVEQFNNKKHTCQMKLDDYVGQFYCSCLSCFIDLKIRRTNCTFSAFAFCFVN